MSSFPSSAFEHSSQTRGKSDATDRSTPTKRVLQIADHVADSIGVLRRPFSVERMLRRASRRTGLRDFGNEEFMAALTMFMRSCVEESDLSVIGRIATHWDVMRFLINLLRLRAAETASPAIEREPITAPVFVAGLPRSGTSFLHRLLTQDSANMVPTAWQTTFPCPDPRDIEKGRDRRVERVDRQLRAFSRLAPEFVELHPLTATSPQECSEITAHVFASLRFDTTYQIPSYRNWLDRTGHSQAYRFHRKFLQYLQYVRLDPVPGQRWVLKCPDHVFALDEIHSVYPDARLVFVHRDPRKVLLSVARLTDVLRRPFVRRIDPVQIGRQESARWLAGTHRMMAASDATARGMQIHHIQYRELVADPLGTVEALYRKLGLELPADAAERIHSFVREKPNGGYGVHRYRAEDYGLDLDEEREKFAAYVGHFDIAWESG